MFNYREIKDELPPLTDENTSCDNFGGVDENLKHQNSANQSSLKSDFNSIIAAFLWLLVVLMLGGTLSAGFVILILGTIILCRIRVFALIFFLFMMIFIPLTAVKLVLKLI